MIVMRGLWEGEPHVDELGQGILYEHVTDTEF